MVLGSTCPSSSNASQERLPGAHQPALKRRRSLSQFYFAKSQSFNCMSDLLKSSAFSKSSLLLAKRSSSSSGRHHCSFEGISEDMSECTSPRTPCPSVVTAAAGAVPVPAMAPQLQQESWFAASCCCSLERHSWDGSSCGRRSSDTCSSLPDSLSAAFDEQQPQLQPSLGSGVCHLNAASSLSSSSDSSMMAAAEADDACWCVADRGATDSLCMALQTTSLAAAAAAAATPHGLIGMPGHYTLAHGFQTLAPSSVMLVE